MSKPTLFGKTLEELQTITAEFRLPRFTAEQLAGWLYKNPVSSFDEMTNLSKLTRAKLAEHYLLGLNSPDSQFSSIDGTKKYLFRYQGRAVESAWIPEKTRSTLCLSTQVGCRRGCCFCMTAQQGFQANLKTGEILNQYRSLPEEKEVTHLVFMGMGEPLDNLDATLKSLEILSAPWGFGLSPQKITVSTIGILDKLEQFLEASQCRFALSVHSPFPDERAKIIPYERRYPLYDILAMIRRAQLGQRRFTVEYLMIDGWNDEDRHAKELARILKGLHARINLIPYHPIPSFPGKSSPMERIENFRKKLKSQGYVTTIRRSRGLDIGAACGLLSTLGEGSNTL